MCGIIGYVGGQAATPILLEGLHRLAYRGDDTAFEEAFRRALRQVEGASAVIAVHSGEPDRVLAARLGNAGGIVVGKSSGEMYLASDLAALLSHTRQVVFLASREMATVTATGARYSDLDGKPLEKQYQTISQDAAAANKGGYKHFMLKEMMEQPEAVTN